MHRIVFIIFFSSFGHVMRYNIYCTHYPTMYILVYNIITIYGNIYTVDTVYNNSINRIHPYKPFRSIFSVGNGSRNRIIIILCRLTNELPYWPTAWTLLLSFFFSFFYGYFRSRIPYYSYKRNIIMYHIVYR